MPNDIKKHLKKLLPLLLQAQKDGLNEANTVQRLIEVFIQVLGYDRISDISLEEPIKGKRMDMVLKVDGQIRLIVEAKAANEPLKDRHIQQAQMYAFQEGRRWVVLTNGVHWNLYYVPSEQGEDPERAFEVDLSNEEDLDSSADKLALLHKQAMRAGELDAWWSKNLALNTETLVKAVFAEDVLNAIRREIHRQDHPLVATEDLADAIWEMFDSKVREEPRPKIRSRRQGSKRAAPAGQTAGNASASGEEDKSTSSATSGGTNDGQAEAADKGNAETPSPPK